MTKLSHLHFVSTAEYARRVAQLGEDPSRIVVSGAPSLDNLHDVTVMSRTELRDAYGVETDPAPLLVTFHPVTLELDEVDPQTLELLSALSEIGLPLIFTQPNPDSGGRRVGALIARFVESHPQAVLVDNFGVQGYFSVMTYAAVMVGNSSSGLIEAPSFGLPVVNIGSRQRGRVRGLNVIDVEPRRADILSGIRRALDPDFRRRLRTAANPYGNGRASAAIVERLKAVSLSDLVVKSFYDVSVPHPLVQD